LTSLLPVVIVRSRRGAFGDQGLDLGLLAATVAVAILVNAAVCGVLSNPHNRYGARIIWIATFAVALVPLRVAQTRRLQAVGTVDASPARHPA
jgi:hypothetical protein